MAWFKKKTDFISDRERTLKSEIAQFEEQIKELEAQLQHGDSQPRLRSTAVPQGSHVSHSIPSQPIAPPNGAHEPIFEDLGTDVLNGHAESADTADHYNELGVRKYDLPALWRRIRHNLQGPSTTNPKLVSYLAAGGLQGLRPLRYEKRVARNRTIFFVLVLVCILVGTYWVFIRRH